MLEISFFDATCRESSSILIGQKVGTNSVDSATLYIEALGRYKHRKSWHLPPDG
jgi:hypothetical protein